MNQTLTLTRIESKLFLRDWTGVFFVFALPVGLLTIFSLVSGGNDGSDGVPTSFLPTMAIGIGIGMLGMATLPMILANYREKGILRRMSTTPVQPVKVLVAQLLLHLAAVVVVIALIVGIGKVAFGAGLPASPLRFTVAAALPESLRWLRDITPMGAGMSGMQDAWTGAWPGLAHTVAMLTATALCVGLAARFFRWE